MRLVIKRNGQTVNEFQFNKGPVYIGRHAHSQVFLPDRLVSRQHAAIYTTTDGKWVIEDLDSANKTYLNDKEIHKEEIKTGDCIRIADFTIEIDLEVQTTAGEPIHLEDTLVSAPVKLGTTSSAPAREIIVRKPDIERAPDITLPAKRIKDFLQATETICKAHGLDDMLKVLLSITLRQFSGYHAWCALRNLPSGSMTSHAGKCRDGSAVELGDIKLHKKITQAVDKKEFVLVPRVSSLAQEEKICSAMIAPIIDPAGCFGVLYIDNALDHEHYSLSDLDYLMLLTIHTAAIVENF